jgi:hypothetical protein
MDQQAKKPLDELSRATRVAATQGKCQGDVEAMAPELVARLAAACDSEGKMLPGYREEFVAVWDAFLESMKATEEPTPVEPPAP